MFSRVVAGGIAAFFFVMPTVSSGETNPPGDDTAPATAVIAAASAAAEQGQAPVQDQTQPPQPAPAKDGQAGAQNQAQPAETTPAPDKTSDQPVAVAPLQDQTQDQAQLQPPAGTPTQILLIGTPQPDSAPPLNFAALDPAEPSIPTPDLAAPIAPPPALNEPFGRNVVPVLGGEIFTKWSGVEAGIRADTEVLARCRTDAATCPSAARNFLAIVAQGRALSGRARVGTINRAVNMAIIPTSDLEQWGVIDRWSPPLETFTTGRGDCEDYAIAKYVALTQAGIAADDVRLVVVRNLAMNEDHAVVAVRLDGHWIILDNRWLKMVDADAVTEAVPLFVLDQTGVRAFAPAAAPVANRAAPASF